MGDVYMLCSDGLSGPVSDPELGAFCEQFHPEQACRYLVHLANLRGGQDNITSVIVRLGPWHEPGEVPSEAQPTKPAPAARGGFRLSSLLSRLRGSKPAPVEEHIYQSAD